jgi:aryl-alcohol dehydrogenase-like predicted oxidoreductase
MDAQSSAKQKGAFGIAIEEHRYNLMCRLPELELLPAAKKLGIAVFAYSPLNAGVLAGSAFHDKSASRRSEANVIDAEHPKPYNYMDAIDMKPRLAEFSKMCGELGQPQANVALAWILSRPNVTGPIVGSRTVQQLESLLPAIDLKLPGDFLSKLETIFPGPGGHAPEAYAW